MVSDWLFRLKALFGRRGMERDLDDELRAHVEHMTERYVGAGVPLAEARRRSLSEFGGLEQIREECRDARGVRLLEDLWRDCGYAARTLRRQPGFALVVIVTLALGIGANAAIFQLIEAVQFRMLAVTHPEQLVEIQPVMESRWGETRGRRTQITFAIWEELRRHQEPFSGVLAWGTNRFDLSTSGESRLVDGLWVSGEFFDVLGVPAALGRVFKPEDDVRGCAAASAVISYAFWQREFGGASGVVGRTLRLDGHPLEIVGVTAADFTGVEVGRSFDVAVPICAEAQLRSERALNKKHYWWLDAFGRLKPGWSRDRANRYLAVAAPSVFAATVAPAFPPDDAKIFLKSSLRAQPAGTGVSYLRGQYQEPLWILLALSGLVQLIACANLANLLLARASARDREVAVRLAIGASRGRIVRELVAESLVLTALGAALGAAVAQSASGFLVAFISTDRSRLVFDLRPDWHVLAFAGLLAVATCMLFGLVPALTATRPNAVGAMQSSRRTTGSREGARLRRLLVVAQVALSLVLIVGAALFVRSVRNLATVDPGFRVDNVLAADFDVRGAKVSAAGEVVFTREMLSRVAAIPGVEAVAGAAIQPGAGEVWNDEVIVDGAPQRTITNENHVSPGFFRLFETPLLAGRDFNERDVPGAPRVAIVNQIFAERILHTRNPIGRMFRLQVSPGEPDPVYQVIGLVANTKYNDVRQPLGPIAYFPKAQDVDPRSPEPLADLQMFVRGRIPVAQLTGGITAAAREVNPALLVTYRTLERDIQNGFLRERLMATLSGFFGAVAALLAAVGLYGTMSYTVARRRNEIGIRLALGAARPRVVGMVMGDAAVLVLVGLAVGVPLALAVTRGARSLLFGVAPWDPVTVAAAVCLLALISAAAACLPAFRAARFDPNIALREE